MGGNEAKLSISELREDHLNFIADYWLKNDPEYLKGMGVALEKLPAKEDLLSMLTQQIQLPLEEKQSYATIWEVNGKAMGHCNVNDISFGEQAFMHLHIWDRNLRGKGLGEKLLIGSIRLFFGQLQLKRIYCQPYSLNPAPNKILKKVGFQFVRTHRCVPGSLNFEQEVNLWLMEKREFEGIQES